MFISMNKKIIYSIVLLFFFTSLIFIYTFYKVYGNKIQEEQLQNINKNQQYFTLINKNINLTRELHQIIKKHPHIEISDSEVLKSINTQTAEAQIKQLTEESLRISENIKNYDSRYQAIQESFKILILSSLLIIIAILLLAYLMKLWILNPINRISAITQKVSNGDLSSRISRDHSPKFTDELDFLITTFNKMLDNLQSFITEIKDKEKFLQALIDSIPDGIRVIDENYNIIIANKAYKQQISSKNKNCEKCFASSHSRKTPCSYQEYHCPLHEIIKNKNKNIRVVQQFAGQPQKHLSINAAPLQYKDHTKYIIEAIRDLSDDINFSHQQKLSSLGFLSTSIAHEIKNHLGALRIILERLIDKFYANKSDEDEDKKHIILIYNELLSCINVPERLLKLSRAVEDKKQEIDCGSAIKDVLGLLDFEAKSKGINIEFTLPSSPLYISGNEADFKMAIINLILNALKAMDANGILTIKAENTNKRIKLSFNDTGVGIPPQNINRIFEPFFSDGRENQQKGNGLGLAITKSIVEKSGGNISVTSKVGVGSCFTLSFPQIKKLAKKEL